VRFEVLTPVTRRLLPCFQGLAVVSLLDQYQSCGDVSYLQRQGVGIDHSVRRLVTDWTFRGSHPEWGRGFPYTSRPAPDATQPPLN